MPTLIDQDYIINAGPGGTFRKSGDYQSVPADIDRIFDRFRQDNVRKIAVYFHGGLVSEAGGLTDARKMAPVLAGAGATPVCFVWETGLMETIGNNLSKISETTLFNKLLKVILKRVTDRLGFDTLAGRGVASPGLSDAEIEFELRRQDPFSQYNRSRGNSGRSATQLTVLSPNSPFLEAELTVQIGADINADKQFQQAIQTTKVTVDATGQQTGARGLLDFAGFIAHAVKIAIRIIKRFIEHRDHDLYPTVVEEILRELYIAELGAWVWGGMKDKSIDMWKDNTGRTDLDQYAGRYFLDKLAQYKADNPATEINLVGHSAGSIAICNLLKATDTLALKFKYNHIIFMAPACRVDLFKSEMVDHQERYADLRIFTMNDDKECDDKLVPYFYTHSLLYLISGVLEDEGASYDAYILGLQRDIAYLSPYAIAELQPVHDYLYEDAKFRTAFSLSPDGASDGMTTGSLSHGGFDDDPKTLLSIQYILQQ